MSPAMSPTPKKQPLVPCPHCGTLNEPSNTRCIGCKAPLNSAVQPFTFPVTGEAVRVVTIDGEPWFVAVDVATILGYANTRKAINDHVPARHQKGNDSFPLADLGLHPQTKLISEAGLYRLVMRSDVPLAEPFQDWVTDDVLPSIRRTGSYSVAGRELPQDYSAALRALADEHDAHRITRQERDAAQQRAAELEPAADARRSSIKRQSF